MSFVRLHINNDGITTGFSGPLAALRLAAAETGRYAACGPEHT